jgi:glycerol-3-phosphate acyltransferase PlsX
MRMHKDGTANAVVSAGNTGAVMANAVLTLGRIAGVSRPAIATTFPNKLESKTVFLDVGANVDVKPENLLQFAQMGASYCEDVLKVVNPRVALLSIGEERSKGNDVTVASHELLKKGTFNFIGNVEGRDILEGTVDVIVCDGFIGNIILKFAESMKVFLETRIKKQISSNFFSRAGAVLMGPFLRRIRRTFDYAEYGGAPLLGIAGNCVIAHGSSSSRAICNAIKVAHEMLITDVNGHIRRRVENFKKTVVER